MSNYHKFTAPLTLHPPLLRGHQKPDAYFAYMTGGHWRSATAIYSPHIGCKIHHQTLIPTSSGRINVSSRKLGKLSRHVRRGFVVSAGREDDVLLLSLPTTGSNLAWTGLSSGTCWWAVCSTTPSRIKCTTTSSIPSLNHDTCDVQVVHYRCPLAKTENGINS